MHVASTVSTSPLLIMKNYDMYNPIQKNTILIGKETKDMPFRKHPLGYLGLVLVFFMIASTVSARPFRIGKLPDKGKNFSCGTCHVNPGGGGPQNAFGKDYAKVGMKAGDTYTKDLSAMDSDKDGFSNDREFAAGTHPGDPGSKPTK